VKKYRLAGWGRKVGAIGVSSFFVCDVNADNEADARLRVYDHYEHISQLHVVSVDGKKVN
jgi:hypothetical protein